jgi:hypothetical protein
MASIDVERFAQKIREYHQDTERPESWFHPMGIIDHKEDSVERTLCALSICKENPHRITQNGIRFGYNTRLVMRLLDRAYCYLHHQPDLMVFSEQVAKAMQDFAKPFPEGENLCYPHFLLHGLVQPTLDAVVDKIHNNSRIIHETLCGREAIIAKNRTVPLGNSLELVMVQGLTDDLFGIAYLLTKADEILKNSASGYVAKACFFIDQTNKELYVMTLQSRRYESLGPSHIESQSVRAKIGEKEFARIGNLLGRSPRRYILERVVDFGRKNGFTKIKIVLPEEHPLYIENHDGFLANYGSVIRKAGITEERGCYLEKRLN